MTARLQHRHQLPRFLILIAVAAALLVASVPASAEEASVRLSIKPVGEDRDSFFTVTATPGDSVQLEVELSNIGSTPMEATTFAADTFTMPNGGFGINDLGDPQTGTTKWVTYPTETLTIDPEQAVIRAFTLTIPADAQPGDYLTSLVIQNTNAIEGEGTVALSQIVRQAVAVSIDVPGPRVPALTISSVHHESSGSHSVISFDVGNSGNTHLKPAGEFALKNANGIEIVQRTVAMDRFYSATQTTFSVGMDDLLAPGEYYASLTLTDPTTGVTARIAEAPVTVPVVDVPAVLNTDGSVAQPAATNAPAEANDGASLALLGGIAAGFLVLGVGSAIVAMRVRAGRNSVPVTPIVSTASPVEVSAPVATRPGHVKPLITRSSTDHGRVVQPTVGTDAQ